MLYQNFISLGYNCATASSMGKCGLRNMSSPFDWCRSSLGGVLHFLETDFEDFLAWENLVELEEPKTFQDIKWGITYVHDIKNDLQTDYADIYSKYQRRIERFRDNITGRPTCFIRAVRNAEEVGIIEKRYGEIEAVIKAFHPENKIIFLLLKPFPELPEAICSYRMNVERYVGKYNYLRCFFDSNQEFQKYCREHIAENIYRKNLEFDNKKRIKRFGKWYKLAEWCLERPGLNEKEAAIIRDVFVKKFGDISQGIFIFGTGRWSEPGYKMMREGNIPVNGFFDNDRKKWGTIFNDMSVGDPVSLKTGRYHILIASTAYEMEINRQLEAMQNDELRWLTLSELQNALP